jgi:DNA-binding SARP family transcriptional activator
VEWGRKAPLLEIKLFGTGSGIFDGRPLSGFPNQQPCQLFCYLLLNRTHPHHRESLAAVFWGDQPAYQARKALRNAIWRLRHTFQAAEAPVDDYLAATQDHLSFLPGGSYWLDIEEFENSMGLLEKINGWDMDQEQSLQLEKTVSIYTGNLLANNYADWVLYDRERYGMAYENALSKLMVYYGCQNNPERGVACGERILQRDKTRESVHRNLMWLYCLMGDRSGALAQFKVCRQILRDELGIDPMDKTRHLYDQILSNRIIPDPWRYDVHSPSSPNDRPASASKASITQQTLNEIKKRIDETSAELHLLETMVAELLAHQSDIGVFTQESREKPA